MSYPINEDTVIEVDKIYKCNEDRYTGEVNILGFYFINEGVPWYRDLFSNRISNDINLLNNLESRAVSKNRGDFDEAMAFFGIDPELARQVHGAYICALTEGRHIKDKLSYIPSIKAQTRRFCFTALILNTQPYINNDSGIKVNTFKQGDKMKLGNIRRLGYEVKKEGVLIGILPLLYSQSLREYKEQGWMVDIEFFRVVGLFSHAEPKIKALITVTPPTVRKYRTVQNDQKRRG